ncbi:hypothetical protein GL305_31915 [Nocardia seriolae]|uniref:DUF6630 family protein n=1 Tax=Nocardia seriolae TaxID=37332 RepID=UPI0004B665AD|nr:hypothetical protein [Nocardia seriolae]MTJ65567.1 hypothetical protein [Nocardia seriolae]MTJ75493.1 hypothetical protein [Nocardia seriolae]MTJ90445.1 hypothetical protein [Nocardia seriolae]MTK34405.1 hypothetical protein [Nocardia seriolae]MTK43558.1 hypothetical protein [Nocardia seriolae]
MTDESMQTPDAVRVALPQIVAILAPDRPDIMALLDLVLDDPESYVDAYPDSDYLCNDEGDLARRGLLEMLDGTEFEFDSSLIAHFDWRADVETIHEGIASLSSCPATMNWDWLLEFATATREHPDDSVGIAGDFLEETGNRCLQLGVALVSVDDGDSYHVGFCPATEAEHVISLFATAGYENPRIRRA